MPVSTLTTKYQATIPKQVRDALHLGAGDRIEFMLGQDRVVRVRKAPSDARERQSLDAMLGPEWSSSEDDDAYADL